MWKLFLGVLVGGLQTCRGLKLFEEAEEFWGLCPTYCSATPLVSMSPIVLREPSQSWIPCFQILCGPLGRRVRICPESDVLSRGK